MGKTAILLPEEYKEKAIANKISIQTVYQRLKRGWDLERAVTEPPKTPQHLSKLSRDEGMIRSGNRPKGSKTYGFVYYKDREKQLDQAIAESGLSVSDFMSKIVDDYLEKRESNGQRKRKEGKAKNG